MESQNEDYQNPVKAKEQYTEEYVRISFTQINLLIMRIGYEKDDSKYEKHRNNIFFILEKGSIEISVRYWRKILSLTSHDLTSSDVPLRERTNNLLIALLYDSFKEFAYKEYIISEYIRDQVFNEEKLREICNLDTSTFLKYFDTNHDSKILSTLLLNSLSNSISESEKPYLSDSTQLQDVISNSNRTTFPNNFTNLLLFSDPSNTVGILALFLSEIITPTSRFFSNRTDHWLIPENIKDGTALGKQVSQALNSSGLISKLNWNDIYGALSSKYILKEKTNATPLSINILFCILEEGDLIYSFFHTRWSMFFKFQILASVQRLTQLDDGFKLIHIHSMAKVFSDTEYILKDTCNIISIMCISIELLVSWQTYGYPDLSEVSDQLHEDMIEYPEFFLAAFYSNEKLLRSVTEHHEQLENVINFLIIRSFSNKSSFLKGIVKRFLPNSDQFEYIISLLQNQSDHSLLIYFFVLLKECSLLNRALDIFNGKQLVSLLKWDNGSLSGYLVNFLLECTSIDILRDIMIYLDNSYDSMDNNFISIYVNGILLKVLNLRRMKCDFGSSISKILFKYLIKYPKLIQQDKIDETWFLNISVSKSNSIDENVQEMIQLLFKGHLTVDTIIKSLVSLKRSGQPADNEEFCLIIRFLISESQFFSSYPNDALQITSLLFRSILSSHICDEHVKSVMFDIIMNCSKEKPQSKLFSFAVICLSFNEIVFSDFRQYFPEISTDSRDFEMAVEIIENQGDNILSSLGYKQKSIQFVPFNYFRGIKIDSSVPQQTPKTEISDHIQFFINNLTKKNFVKEVGSFKKIFSISYCKWFAHCLVTQKANCEMNKLLLYLKCLISIGSNLLTEYTLNETLRQLIILLSLEKRTPGEETILGNLSYWLGLITYGLAVNSCTNFISFKNFLVNGYLNSDLDTVIPHICKFLLGVNDANMVKPPNKMSIEIIQVLLECMDKECLKSDIISEIKYMLEEFKLKPENIMSSNILSLKRDSENNLNTIVNNLTKSSSFDVLKINSQIKQNYKTPFDIKYNQQVMKSNIDWLQRVPLPINDHQSNMTFSPSNINTANIKNNFSHENDISSSRLDQLKFSSILQSVPFHQNMQMDNVLRPIVDQVTFSILQWINQLNYICRGIQSSQIIVDDFTKYNMYQIIIQLSLLIQNSQNNEVITLKVVQGIMPCYVITFENIYCRDLFTEYLNDLRRSSLSVEREIFWWFKNSLTTIPISAYVLIHSLQSELLTIFAIDMILTLGITNNIDGFIGKAIYILSETKKLSGQLSLKTNFITTMNTLITMDDDKLHNALTQSIQIEIIPICPTGCITEGERLRLVFVEWINLLSQVEFNDQAIKVFIRQLSERNVLLSTNDIFKLIDESLSISISAFNNSMNLKEAYEYIDGLALLIIELYLNLEITEFTRSDLLNFSYITIVLKFSKDYQQRDILFNPRIYFRLFSSILCIYGDLTDDNLSTKYDNEEKVSIQITDPEFYTIFGEYIHTLQPIAFPGFSFAFISLFSHRMFLPILLKLPNNFGWKTISLLISDSFNFISLYNKDIRSSEIVTVYYNGLIKILLSISKDNPDFLIFNHFQLMNTLPNCFLQAKNIILSSTPRMIQIPDSKLFFNISDVIPKSKSPTFSVNMDPYLKDLRKPINNYLRIPKPSLIESIRTGLHSNPIHNNNGIGYNSSIVDIKVLRALISHVLICVGHENEGLTSSSVLNENSSSFTLVKGLLITGDAELQFFIISILFEHLRYPNSHTYWSMNLLLYIFDSHEFKENLKNIKELILRCMLERLMGFGPYPWGLITLLNQLVIKHKKHIIEASLADDVPELKTFLNHVLQKFTTTNFNKEITGTKVQ